MDKDTIVAKLPELSSGDFAGIVGGSLPWLIFALALILLAGVAAIALWLLREHLHSSAAERKAIHADMRSMLETLASVLGRLVPAVEKLANGNRRKRSGD